ncbi:dihydropteroate synthase [Sphingomonas turrisvirgatae]|uniref:dihydropteroate synthase n=1 Tax=Sphingomonas turrisvirgatae TaxID=1888892 RepID=A0A1E3LS21_9SPHN|nr:dihydropteroate synthase [Sphingomonas turrisvirgatae]ODP35995.1 dihydropteroate synthase [Sphingomonas turrisvirgatae]
MDLPVIASSDRVYLRPVAFVDSPINMDDAAVRLAGGLLWFSAYELIVVRDGRRIVQRAIPAGNLPSDERLRAIAARVTGPRPPLSLGERILRFDQPQVMGILNMTPDSFSDGGQHLDNPAAAVAAGVDMGVQGAALIDAGGESTRPGAKEVWEGDEIARVIPAIEGLARSGTLVSVDTRKAGVMEAALNAGAHIVNDVSALLWDDRALEVVVRAQCPVVLMHAGDPRQGADGGRGYGDALIEVYDWLEARIDAVVAAGVDRSRIIADPGIGFGKSLADNLALLNGLAMFHGLGVPLLLGASRKRIVGALSNEAPAEQRLGGSIALALKGADAGVQLLRVHDVPETVQALRVWRGLRDAALTGR